MREPNINFLNFPVSRQTSKAVYGFRSQAKTQVRSFTKNTVT